MPVGPGLGAAEVTAAAADDDAPPPSGVALVFEQAARSSDRRMHRTRLMTE
jgi:hypothetical protein